MTSVPSMAIIGSQGHLASSLYQHYCNQYNIKMFGQHKFDLRNRTDIDSLADEISEFDIIINCAGIFCQDVWDELIVNATAPIYLLSRLAILKCCSRFVQIGSHSAMWTSWPGISVDRLCYNVSKNCVQTAITGLSHSKQTDMMISIINPSKFKSGMSNYEGYEITEVIEYVNFVINSSNPPLIIEMESSSGRMGNKTTT